MWIWLQSYPADVVGLQQLESQVQWTTNTRNIMLDMIFEFQIATCLPIKRTLSISCLFVCLISRFARFYSNVFYVAIADVICLLNWDRWQKHLWLTGKPADNRWPFLIFLKTHAILICRISLQKPVCTLWNSSPACVWFCQPRYLSFIPLKAQSIPGRLAPWCACPLDLQLLSPQLTWDETERWDGID